MKRCYLGLGSNLRFPERQLRQAIESIRKIPRSGLKMVSSLYHSSPLGVRAQPPYCNMVLCIDTQLAPQQLLKHCQRIERQQQRIRKTHWGARTLDIDLLLFGDDVIHQRGLTVPHPQITYRDFVLIPLLELNPQAKLPSGEHLSTYLPNCHSYLQLK